MYTTLRATVQEGKIKLLQDIPLPENATLLVTVLEEPLLETLTLGEHLIGGLQDILNGDVTVIGSRDELKTHLDQLFSEA